MGNIKEERNQERETEGKKGAGTQKVREKRRLSRRRGKSGKQEEENMRRKQRSISLKDEGNRMR